jgi:endogenous inhibitor of DNA gyrase (YacG/DUF329 family)
LRTDSFGVNINQVSGPAMAGYCSEHCSNASLKRWLRKRRN